MRRPESRTGMGSYKTAYKDEGIQFSGKGLGKGMQRLKTVGDWFTVRKTQGGLLAFPL